MDRLYRTRLLFGDNGVNKLKNATVMIVGCGAVGSFAAEALARTGVGHLILIDFDNIEESNINRQIFALNSTIGKQKVNVAAQRIQDINPDIQVDVFNMFLDANNTPDCNPDIIIDAIDTVDSKIALYQWAYKKQIPWISSMGAALKTVRYDDYQQARGSYCMVAKLTWADVNNELCVRVRPEHDNDFIARLKADSESQYRIGNVFISDIFVNIVDL